MDDLRVNMEAADSRVKPWQTAIQKGHYFRHPTDYGFGIYGETMEGYEEGELKNYRFCYRFSETCPEGERGSVR